MNNRILGSAYLRKSLEGNCAWQGVLGLKGW